MMTRDEETLYNQFLQNGVDSRYTGWSVGGTEHLRYHFLEEGFRWGGKVEWGDLLGRGIVQAVSSAIDVVSGHAESLGESKGRLTEAQRANNWFLDSYPLLGSLAADFALIEDSILCKRLDISIAAIDIVHKEIYINPAAGLSYEECKFVLAHEYLHAGLCHHERRQGRDPSFWNVACDYVINDWLIEMGVGEFPKVGGLLRSRTKGAKC